MSVLKERCAYCNGLDELRPYGRDRARICFDCATKPENEAQSIANYQAMLAGAEAEGGVAVLTGDGPKPLHEIGLGGVLVIGVIGKGNPT